jgi:pimeloyl-ACP methyl ester carboxylesterase
VTSSRTRATSGPIVFGQLFGWYHAPSHPMRDGGVVLCNPFGYEAMCLHRCYRVLAEQIAASGLAVLRFDYHGTGDSAGTDHDPERLSAWLASITAAVDELRHRAEVTKVSLVGMRLGATLATLLGLEQQDPNLLGLVLWSPYLTGRAFVREMRMMQTAGAEQAFASAEDRGASPATMRKADPSSTDSTDEEAIGYALTTDTVAELGRVDLRARKDVRPAPRVLLLGRDDLPEDERFIKHLTSVGVDVTDGTKIPGYAAMMQDAYLSKVPVEAYSKIVSWLGEVHPELVPYDYDSERPTLIDFSREGPALVALPTRRDAKKGNEEIEGVLSTRAPHATPSQPFAREESFMFGPQSRLFGILCEPGTTPGDRRSVDAVIFLNVGSNHRVGSNRMYVKMARSMASRGLTSLRFDVSGIGDSIALGVGNENRLYAKEAVDDVRSAMDALHSLRNVQNFFLVGLCSGAYLAFQSSHVDTRIVGQILINTQTFHWKEGDTLEVSLRRNYRSTRYYTTEMWNPQVWGRVLRGEVNARGIAGTLAQRALDRAKRGAAESLARVRHGRLEIDDVAAQFKDTLRRGAETLLIFGANDGGLDLMEAHLGPEAKKLQKYQNFRLEIVEGADHTFTPLWSQMWLEKLIIATIERWRGAI